MPSVVYFYHMISVVILGAGNVGSQLCQALDAAEDCEVIQLYNRTEVSNSQLPDHIEFTTKINEIKQADVYLLAIADDAIAGFSEHLPFKDSLLAHTSGTVPLHAIDNKNRRAVFYPLQTFSQNRSIDFNKVPIGIEAESEADLSLLKSLASSLSEKVMELNSNDRSRLHLAAVFVNNFSNHLYHIAAEYLEENSLEFDLLTPLILETADKISSISPEDAQTGPARRGDLETIKKHLALLNDGPKKELYKVLTESIQNTYGKKL